MRLMHGDTDGIINENIRALVKGGMSQAEAIRVANAKARKAGDIELPNESGISDIHRDTGNSRTGPLEPYYWRGYPYRVKGGDPVDPVGQSPKKPAKKPAKPRHDSDSDYA